MKNVEYEKLAATEGEMWYFEALHQRMLIHLARWHGKPADLLDAGCGTGGFIGVIQQREPLWKITGLDFSELACKFSRQNTQVEIVQGSITDLPFSSNQFDILTCADVLSHVDDGLLAIKEFCRVLRPGGIVIINVPAYQWMWSYHDVSVETRHRYRRGELMRMVKGIGLRPLQASYANTFIFPLIIARRKLFPPSSPSSDVKAYSPLVEKVCGTMARIENAWLERGGSLPTGCSVFLAAQKII